MYAKDIITTIKSAKMVRIMRIKLLIATCDNDYAGHLSNMISEHHADIIEVCVCSTAGCLRELLTAQRFDVALLAEELAGDADLRSIHLPLLLWAEGGDSLYEGSGGGGGGAVEQLGSIPAVSVPRDRAECARGMGRISKYQRISALVANMLEQYAKVSPDSRGYDSKRARITAVWSPAGGVGKTTVALAYAGKMASEGKQALYLNLEHFSSAPAYFHETGRSISSVFEMLEAHEGNVRILISGIRCQESGVSYFCRPDNFDDMNILSPENIAALVDTCSEMTDELIIDMSSVCGERERQVFDLADSVFIVTDSSSTAQAKLCQFSAQHNVFGRIKEKAVFIANRGAEIGAPLVDTIISLPFVQTADAVAVFKTLSCNCFEARAVRL